MTDPHSLLAACLAAASVGLLIRAAFPPRKSLHRRLDPDLRPTPSAGGEFLAKGVVGKVFGPPARQIARSLGHVLENTGDQVAAVSAIEIDLP